MNSISVRNFKSVIDSGTFELRPLTVLAGVNSSGKSSLLQAMLLLKQTLEAGSKDTLKTIGGPYVVANEPLDLAYGKKRSNVISITLTIDAEEFEDQSDYSRFLRLVLAETQACNRRNSCSGCRIHCRPSALPAFRILEVDGPVALRVNRHIDEPVVAGHLAFLGGDGQVVRDGGNGLAAGYGETDHHQQQGCP